MVKLKESCFWYLCIARLCLQDTIRFFLTQQYRLLSWQNSKGSVAALHIHNYLLLLAKVHIRYFGADTQRQH